MATSWATRDEVRAADVTGALHLIVAMLEIFFSVYYTFPRIRFQAEQSQGEPFQWLYDDGAPKPAIDTRRPKGATHRYAVPGGGSTLSREISSDHDIFI